MITPTTKQIDNLNRATDNKYVCSNFNCEVMQYFGRPCIFIDSDDVINKNRNCPYDTKTIQHRIVLIESLTSTTSEW